MLPFSKTYRLLAVLASVLVAPSSALAMGDALIEGARLCTQRFPVEEQKNTIPTHLLAAIATTESGRWHKGLGMNVPWPWTINVEGKGYYFNSKAEAIAQTQRYIREGRQSIDVGCMQVNLKHHAKAFADLNQAFDPETNVAYAAKFLSDNYADLGDWIKATAAYHSRTPVHGNRYLGEIERSWNRIVAKVAAARAAQPGGGVAAAALGAGAAPNAAMQFKPLPDRPSRPIASTHNVKSITVTDTARPSSGVLVIRSQPSTLATPSAESPRKPAPAAAGDSIRRVSLDTDPASGVANPGQPTTNAPSQFIFQN
jgi:hypothetical protein